MTPIMLYITVVTVADGKREKQGCTRVPAPTTTNPTGGTGTGAGSLDQTGQELEMLLRGCPLGQETGFFGCQALKSATRVEDILGRYPSTFRSVSLAFLLYLWCWNCAKTSGEKVPPLESARIVFVAIIMFSLGRTSLCLCCLACGHCCTCT